MANILLVDDDVALSEMVQFVLTSENHSVKLVHTGFEGYKQLQTNEYDLVILDWDLPDFNGIDVLKKHRDEGGTTPIIMLTGHTSVQDKVLGLTSGANDYLAKPFHLDELQARILTALRSKAAAAPVPKALGTNNQEVLKQGNLIGTSLAAHYEFLEVIGSGGVANVFKARHPRLDKLVAIKMLQSEGLTQELVARFEQEAQVISRLEHPNIINVHDFGVTEHNYPYMVMEFITGDNLMQLMEKRDFLPLQEGLELLLQVCDGLEHAHQSGIIHRDIKPSNIMLKQITNRAAVPKLLDFGMAKLKEMANQKPIHLTQVRQSIGSPPYMSPEQIRGKTLDERTDIYSLGCVILEVFTGYPPHLGHNVDEILNNRLEKPPLTFAELRPNIQFPPQLQALVSKALELDPSNRYQTVGQLRDELASIRLLPAQG